MAANFKGRLPDGTTTTRPTVYTKTWRTLGAPIAHAVGGRVYAFDPGLFISLPSGQDWHVPTEAALLLAEHLNTR